MPLNDRKHFDVIVIGGGPAGSAASRTLAASGIDVCVVDKHVFPRYKLCGGSLTQRSKRIFDRVFGVSWDTVIEAASRGAVFYCKDRFLNSVEDYKDIYFISRHIFDDFLLMQARKCGANLLLGNGLRDINIDTNTVRLESGASLSYKYLVAADGVNSIVARTLFGRPFDKSDMAFGLGMEVPTGGKYQRITEPEVYLGIVKWGYGWVFPKKNTLTVGVAGLHGKNNDLKTKFDNFLKMRFGNIPDAKIIGHYIPFGEYRKVPGRDNVLLCGDAAGLVDPITGEGMAFAMLSGYFAAHSIIDILKNNAHAPALSLYMKNYKEITDVLDRAKMLRWFVFPEIMQKIIISAIPRSKRIARRFMDLIISG